MKRPRTAAPLASAQPPDCDDAREPYVKPRLEVVSLVVEEAVLGFCKGKPTDGPDGNNCKAHGACVVNGS